MGSRIASSCPPMTLREREVLDATQLRFFIPTVPTLFPATATQVLTKALLKTFINNILSTLQDDESLTEIPDPDYWGLAGKEDGFLDLNKWDPRREGQDVYRVVTLPLMSDPETLTPIDLRWATLGGESWTRDTRIKSIELPSQEIFESGGSHLLVTIEYRVRLKVKIGKKKSTTIEETQNSVLIPADMKMVDLVNAFRIHNSAHSKVTALFQLSNITSNLRTSNRTAVELGWKHGTELRLEFL